MSAQASHKTCIVVCYSDGCDSQLPKLPGCNMLLQRQQNVDLQSQMPGLEVHDDHARQLNGIRSLADKQLSSLYLSIKPLKDVGYHRFTKQLKRQALA